MTEPQGNEGDSLAPNPGIERAHTTSEQGTRESRLSVVERQWSVGRILDGSGVDMNMNQRSPFSRFEEPSFHASWAGTDSFLRASDLPLGRASFSYQSSFGQHISLSAEAAAQALPLSETRKGIFTAVDDKSTVTSIIHDEARIVNWQVVLKLCQSHPQHAKYADPSGWTALHHACNRRCPREDVVEALIKAYPDALLDLEEKGMTPLHYACRFKAPDECVRHLLHLFPEKGRASVSKRDRKGRTPLYYAVRYDAPPGVVEMLLEVDPSAVLDEDRNADSPLALVWDSWAEKFEGKKTLQPLLYPEESGLNHSTPEDLLADSKLKKRWDTVNMLLRAAFRFPSDGTEHRKWRVMHATAAIKCHPTLFRLAKALYPEQAKELDVGDLDFSHEAPRSALHLAASSPANGDAGSFVLESLLEMNPDAASMIDEEDGSVPLHLIVQNERKSHWSMVRSLLQRNPAAVRSVDKQGRTPLHRAAAAIANHNGTDWSGATSSLELQSTIFNLLQAYPEAANVPDNTGCLPLHLIAAHARIWDAEVDSVSVANEAATRVRAGPAANNSLPLHLAAKNEHAELSLILKLVQLNPRAASQPDSNGKLPFHLACESGKVWEQGVSVIYDAFPDAVRESEANTRRWTALQMAAATRGETGPLIETLTKLNPEAVNRQDSKNRFPLHLACVAGKGWETGLRTLFEANPDAIFIEDTCGLLPFHIAAFRYCKPSEQEIEAALKAKGPVFKSRGIPRTPITEKPSTKSCENEAIQIEVMFELLRAAPNVLKM